MTPTVLAVHAHPDDESITMGGTLARCVADGVRVVLVTCTLGEEGEVIGADLANLVAAESDQLGGYRWWELQWACAALGVTDHRLLGGAGAFRDSGMVGSSSAAHPHAFVRAGIGGPDHRLAVGLLSQIVAQVRPQVVLTYDADGGYGHPDHVTAHQIAVAAASQAEVPRVLAVVRPRAATDLSGFPVPAGYLPATPADLGYLCDEVDIIVDVSAQQDRRRAALDAHRTQVELIPGGFALSNRIAQPLSDREYFRLLTGQPVPAGAADLFAGLQL